MRLQSRCNKWRGPRVFGCGVCHTVALHLRPTPRHLVLSRNRSQKFARPGQKMPRFGTDVRTRALFVSLGLVVVGCGDTSAQKHPATADEAVAAPNVDRSVTAVPLSANVAQSSG